MWNLFFVPEDLLKISQSRPTVVSRTYSLSTFHPGLQMFVPAKTSLSGVKYRWKSSVLFSGTTGSQTYITAHTAKRVHRLSLGPPPTHNPPGLLACHCEQNEWETMANIRLYSSPGFMKGFCLHLIRVSKTDWVRGLKYTTKKCFYEGRTEKKKKERKTQPPSLAKNTE